MTIGIRAVIQHLKCYASKEPLKGKCVDPRWNDSLRGKAMYVEYLGYADNPYKKGWAYPGKGYGKKILTHLNKINKIGKKGNTDEDSSKDNDEKIILKREKKDQVVNTTLSVGFNVLLIYLMLLILHKINKSEQKDKKYNKYKRK